MGEAMKIDSLKISNFRCFGEEPTQILFEDSITAFVGNNGSGKTAILSALAKLFGANQSQRVVRKADFHIPAAGQDLVPDTQLRIDCCFSFPQLAPDAENELRDGAVPEFFHHMVAGEGGEPLRARIQLRATWVEDGTPEGTVEEEVRWIRSFDEQYVWDECQKVHPSERGLIQLVYVPALRNASDQVTALLKGRLWQAALWSQELRRVASNASNRVQDQFDAEEPAEFIRQRLQRRWEEVHQASTDATPSLKLIEGDIAELVRRAEFVFFPDEAGRARRLEDLSDGQRSLFHIALTAAILEIERDAIAVAVDDSAFDQDKLRRVHLTILAIEEPENSLSPFFLSRIMLQARSIGGMEGAQVLISSHSASILARINAEEVRYCRVDQTTRESSVRSLFLPDRETEDGKFVRLAVKAYPEIYFARFAILAEGDSEAVVLPRVAEARNIPLDPSFVPVVPLGGRFVTHFWRLLNDLQIPHATLLDLDLGRAHGGVNAIRHVVEQLAVIDRDMSENPFVLAGEIDLEDIDGIDEEQLLDDDQDHPWLAALRHEGVYFSSPLDLDFAMLDLFPDAYRHPRLGGRGPRMSVAAIRDKKATTLKTGGNPDLYHEDWDQTFAWYPYLFLGDSKPEAHLRALSEIPESQLARRAPIELRHLLDHIRRALSA